METLQLLKTHAATNILNPKDLEGWCQMGRFEDIGRAYQGAEGDSKPAIFEGQVGRSAEEAQYCYYARHISHRGSEWDASLLSARIRWSILRID